MLKTAGRPSADVHHSPSKFVRQHVQSADVRDRPQSSVVLAVMLAVNELPLPVNRSLPPLAFCQLSKQQEDEADGDKTCDQAAERRKKLPHD